MSNVLVRSKLSFNNVEARIFGLALTCIHASDLELPPISIDVRDVITSEKGGSVYASIKAAMDSLQKKTAAVETIRGKRSTYTTYSLLDTLKYDTGTALITGKFAAAIAPFLVQLKSQFTRVEIETLLLLKSAHSHRLYWILKSYQSLGKCAIKVDKLRGMMLGEGNEDKYTAWYEFKRNVLEPAIKELHDLEPAWLVSYAEKKRGKFIDEITFTIPPQAMVEETKQDKPQHKTVLTLDEIETYRDWLHRARGEHFVREYDRLQTIYKLSEYQSRMTLNSFSSDDDFKRLLKTLDIVKEAIRTNAAMKSVGAFTLATIKKEFPKIFSAKAKKQEQSQD